MASNSTSIQTFEGEVATGSGGSQERDGDIQETYPLPSDLESYGYLGGYTMPWMDPRGVENAYEPPSQPYLNQPDGSGYLWTEEPSQGFLPQPCNSAFTDSLEFVLPDNPTMTGHLDAAAACNPPPRPRPPPAPLRQHPGVQHQHQHSTGVDPSPALVVTEVMWTKFTETMRAIESAVMEGLRSAAVGNEGTTAQPYEDRSFVQYPPTYDVAGITSSTANRGLISEELQLASESVFAEDGIPGQFTDDATGGMSDRCPWVVPDGMTSDGVTGVGFGRQVDVAAEGRAVDGGQDAMLSSAIVAAPFENSSWNARYQPEYVSNALAYNISDATAWNSDPYPASENHTFGAELEGTNTECRLVYSTENSHLYAQYESKQLRLSTETTLSNACADSSHQPLAQYPVRGPGFVSEIKIRRKNLETRIVYPAVGTDRAWQSYGVSRNLVGQYRVSENARIVYTQSAPPTVDESIEGLRPKQVGDVYSFSGREKVPVDDRSYIADMPQLDPASKTGQSSGLSMRGGPGRSARRRRMKNVGDTSGSNQKMRRKRRKCSASQSSARTRGKGDGRACGQGRGQGRAGGDGSLKRRLTSKGFQKEKEQQVNTFVRAQVDLLDKIQAILRQFILFVFLSIYLVRNF